MTQASAVRRPRQACGSADSRDRQTMLGHHGRDHLPFRGRRQNFCQHVLDRRVLQRQVGIHALEPGVLRFQFAHARQVRDPAQSLFRAQYVGALMPCLRHTSATGSPASPSFRIATIWLSLNLLFLIGSLLSDWAAFSGFGCLPAGGADDFTSPTHSDPIAFAEAHKHQRKE